MAIATAKQELSRDSFRSAGYWLDKTIDQLLTEAAAKTPDKISIVADRADRDQASRFTYRELENLVDRAASSLRRLGVRPRDVVTVQLPNWWEFVVTAFACSKIGAVVNPVMPILRERELLYILNFCEAKVFIVPKVYRGFEYAAMAEAMRGDLPHLKHLIVVDALRARIAPAAWDAAMAMAKTVSTVRFWPPNLQQEAPLASSPMTWRC